MKPFLVNKRTEFNYTQLIDADGKYYESKPMAVAKEISKQSGLDLVCFRLPEKNQPALCKIIDFGKWKYQEEKSKKKEKQKNKQVVKEVRFSPVISDHDIEHKMNQVIDFLKEGDEVILSMRFKGIQRRHFDLGEEKMAEIVSLCEPYGEKVSEKKTNNNITVRLKQK